MTDSRLSVQVIPVGYWVDSGLETFVVTYDSTTVCIPKTIRVLHNSSQGEKGRAHYEFFHAWSICTRFNNSSYDSSDIPANLKLDLRTVWRELSVVLRSYHGFTPPERMYMAETIGISKPCVAFLYSSTMTKLMDLVSRHPPPALLTEMKTLSLHEYEQNNMTLIIFLCFLSIYGPSEFYRKTRDPVISRFLLSMKCCFRHLVSTSGYWDTPPLLQEIALCLELLYIDTQHDDLCSSCFNSSMTHKTIMETNFLGALRTFDEFFGRYIKPTKFTIPERLGIHLKVQFGIEEKMLQFEPTI